MAESTSRFSVLNIMPLSLDDVATVAEDYRYRLGPAVDALYRPDLTEAEAIPQLARFLAANADILRAMVSRAVIATSDEDVEHLDYVGLIRASCEVISLTRGAHLPGELQATLTKVLTPHSQLLSESRH